MMRSCDKLAAIRAILESYYEDDDYSEEGKRAVINSIFAIVMEGEE